MLSAKHVNVNRRFWTPMRIGSTIVVLSLLAAFGASSCNSTDESAGNNRINSSNNRPLVKVNPSQPNAPAALTTLPANVLDAELRSVSGAPIKLSDYSGKVLLVNLWATWCGPCRIEIPELVKLHKEFKSQGFEVVGLSTENAEASAEGVKDFVRDFGMDYRVGWATREVAITLMQGRDAIPQSFVIARDGRVVKRFVGFNPTTTPPQLRQAVEEALKG